MLWAFEGGGSENEGRKEGGGARPVRVTAHLCNSPMGSGGAVVVRWWKESEGEITG